MEEGIDLQNFIESRFDLAESLCDWYLEHKRDLPWRNTKDPYKIWISEIMLQQTRVEAVKPYYARFLDTLPTVADLAACEEDTYLKLWEGLGYYSRVRNLHAAAVQVMEEHAGTLPADYDKLRALKGIGNYTAGAISAFAFDLPYPAVDGNVLRVMMRLLGLDWDIAKDTTKRATEDLVKIWLQAKTTENSSVSPSNLNQALIELGAIVCLPNGEPHCMECPWNMDCQCYKDLNFDALPVKTSAKPRRIEEKTVFVLQNQEGIFFHKRPQKGLLAGLYEFPNCAGNLNQEEALAYLRNEGYQPIRIKRIDDAKHIFSHVEWHMTGYAVFVDEESSVEHDFVVPVEVAQKEYAIPSAFRAYCKWIGIEI